MREASRIRRQLTGLAEHVSGVVFEWTHPRTSCLLLAASQLVCIQPFFLPSMLPLGGALVLMHTYYASRSAVLAPHITPTVSRQLSLVQMLLALCGWRELPPLSVAPIATHPAPPRGQYGAARLGGGDGGVSDPEDEDVRQWKQAKALRKAHTAARAAHDRGEISAVELAATLGLSKLECDLAVIEDTIIAARRADFLERATIDVLDADADLPGHTHEWVVNREKQVRMAHASKHTPL